MRIVADQNILMPDSWSGADLEVVRLPGRQITRDVLINADALLVRSITRVDRQLLAGTKVQFVGTATSGTDHIDLAWLAQNDIRFTDAAGANAGAVAEYVISALAGLIIERNFDPWQNRIAIVGVGKVGSMLARRLRGMGIDCVGYDPYRHICTDLTYVPLEQALQSDVICLHTPFSTHGEYPTKHMINAENLASMSASGVLINAGRGEVIDSPALLAHLKHNPEFSVILDVWENEPCPDPTLLNRVFIATPHIAGYSVEAKKAASRVVIDAMADAFSLQRPPVNVSGSFESANLNNSFCGAGGIVDIRKDQDVRHSFAACVQQAFALTALSSHFKSEYSKRTYEQRGALFDELRQIMTTRREFSASYINADDTGPSLASWLHAAGFSLQS